MATRVSSPLEQDIGDLTLRAREASRRIAYLNTAAKNGVLLEVAGRLSAPEPRKKLLEANRQDLEAARERGISGALLDRLSLDDKRIQGMIQALRETAALPDPVGVVKRMWTRPNGLRVGKKTIPLGVIGIIYEARPNVTVDAFGLCFKAGNATVLKGGSEALHSNRALVDCIAEVTRSAGVEHACQLLDSTSRAAVAVLLQQEDRVDLIIPRGGEALIRFVSENSRIPVIKHYKGVCHIYLDEGADPESAASIVENAKVSRPGVCNAVETLLVHQSMAASFLPPFAERMQRAGVELRGDRATCEILPGTREASEKDYHTEYLDLILSVRVVRDMEQAIQHIERYGSCHTESILTRDYGRAQQFLDRVNSSVVLVNASTRFSDGGELGLGAEIGISTTKLHAYGPMGLEGLVAEKFIVYGDGQIRE